MDICDVLMKSANRLREGEPDPDKRCRRGSDPMEKGPADPHRSREPAGRLLVRLFLPAHERFPSDRSYVTN